MNKQPIYYLQTDKMWKDIRYEGKGESQVRTIGTSGCGPSCAAMLISTLTGKEFTPKDACAWSVQHGYRYPNQGTAYGYFEPQFKEFGIDCKILNWTNTYHNPKHSNHDRMIDYLKQGYYVIALMNPGHWTSGGHYVVVWWADSKIHVNDPISKKESRMTGNLNTFRNEAKYYWIVDARSYNNPGISPESPEKEDDEDMTGEEIYNRLTAYLESQGVPTWADKKMMEEFEEAKSMGITDGSRPMMVPTRMEASIMAKRAAKAVKKWF